MPQELLGYQPESYRIGPNDVLFITVWNHPELTVPSGPQFGGETNGRTVRPDGTLFYPYIGNIQAAGKTIEELRDEINNKLATFIESPQVDVGVLRYFSQQVVLSGAFAQNTPVPITAKPLTLLEALGMGGIVTTEADLSSLRLTRDGKSYILDVYALTSEPSDIHRLYLKNGDSVHLPYNDQNKVFVMGEVTRPQALAFKSASINLTDAIGTAGGLHQMSSKGQDVYVIRGVPDLGTEKAKIYQLKAKSPSAFILANRFELQPQDVVYVGASGVTRWNRVLSQILPTLSVLGLTSRALRDLDDINTN
ncbi:MAG TPA: polysaccharide biosynthesis/export family protein [Pseudomonadales bacterium]